MNVICLGGAGKICSEAVRDLVQFSDAERITIGDPKTEAAYNLIEDLQDKRVDYVNIDITEKKRAVTLLGEYDIVMDGIPISLNEISTECIGLAGCHGINLNGYGKEYQFDNLFRKNKKIHVPGFGMTPGITNMMVRFAADKMENVEIVRISHGAFRPVAFSPSITETTILEYDPMLENRVVFEDGEFKQVPPFARERLIALPEPFGTHPQWIIPHSETHTVWEYLKEKGIRLIETRGTWPPLNMLLIRALYEWGFMRNESINVSGKEIGILDVISQYLQTSEEGTTTALYGYALHVQVIGTRHGKKKEFILTHTHPSSDGSKPGWEKLRAYTKCVGIPMAIAVDLIGKGHFQNTGVIIPERAFNPEEVFYELRKREILVHIQEKDLK
jgi:saccharopine dehydrogenase-like NADP-dependent oxidoreductase